MTVYVDVLLAVNLYLTFLLLLATERLARVRYTRARRLMASGLGALSALTVFFSANSWLLLLVLRVGIALAIVALASGERRWKPLLSQTVLFFAANALFAGAVLLLSLWRPDFFAVQNGVPVLNLDVWALLAATTLAYAALRLCGYLRARRGGAERTRVTFRTEQGSASADCMVDTGNNLREPFSGLPAAICRLGAVAPLMTPALREAMPALLAGVPADALPPCPGLRLIPGRTVIGNALLPAFGPVTANDGLGREGHLWLAVCRDAALPQCDCLLPAEWSVGGDPLASERVPASAGRT